MGRLVVGGFGLWVMAVDGLRCANRWVWVVGYGSGWVEICKSVVGGFGLWVG